MVFNWEILFRTARRWDLHGWKTRRKNTKSRLIWTASLTRWINRNERLRFSCKNDHKKYAITMMNEVSFGKPITQNIFKDFIFHNGKWSSFEIFKRYNYGVWIITVDHGSKEASCTCPQFLKKSQCKHSLGMLIRLKPREAPEAARSLPLGQKRKRGRPAKAKRALIVM